MSAEHEKSTFSKSDRSKTVALCAKKTSVFGNDLSLVVGTAVLAYSVRHHELSAV